MNDDLWLSYKQMARLTRHLTDGWGHGPIRVERLPGAEYGWTDCRTVVRYAERAPWHTVPHELAHVLAGLAEGHGPTWEAHFVALATRTASLIRPVP